MAGLDFPLFYSLEDGVDDGLGGLREGNLADDERLRIELLDFCAHLQHAASLSVVVFRDVDAAARGEVRVEVELLAVQIGNGRVADLDEVVGQDFRAQSDGDALGALSQQ